MTKCILIVEDEKPIAEIVKFNLEKEGYRTSVAYDGEEGLHKAIALNPDLILLDVMLPKLDGFQVCREIREISTVPILMLTAKEEEVDKVLGFEMGADDYITKPFGMRELLARVKANLRRADVNTDEIDRMEIEKVIKEKYNTLLGKEVRSVDAHIVVEVADKRILKIQSGEYRLQVDKLILTEVMSIWIKVTKTG
jgi:DNA-binding response OmpR family regulator